MEENVIYRKTICPSFRRTTTRTNLKTPRFDSVRPISISIIIIPVSFSIIDIGKPVTIIIGGTLQCTSMFGVTRFPISSHSISESWKMLTIAVVVQSPFIIRNRCFALEKSNFELIRSSTVISREQSLCAQVFMLVGQYVRVQFFYTTINNNNTNNINNRVDGHNYLRSVFVRKI